MEDRETPRIHRYGESKTTQIIGFVIPVAFRNKLDWSVCTCVTQLYLMVKIDSVHIFTIK